MKRATRGALNIAAAVAAIAIAARWSFALPGTEVPQTAQTLAVLLVGIVLGPAQGALAVAAYVLAGAVGLPVFAGGRAGIEVLVGPTSGFLFGFVAAAGLLGRVAFRGGLGTLSAAAAWALAGHGVILAVGWLRLTMTIGPIGAFESGVAPFLVGAVLKSLAVAAISVWIFDRRARRSIGSTR